MFGVEDVFEDEAGGWAVGGAHGGAEGVLVEVAGAAAGVEDVGGVDGGPGLGGSDIEDLGPRVAGRDGPPEFLGLLGGVVAREPADEEQDHADEEDQNQQAEDNFHCLPPWLEKNRK